eukprot:GGOE01011171.1.p1 GENE.GGOE01011171.1~~GGOE01011171.1.p1  ORF type:complete len:132 (-),score=0.42 GGOE01011171.1:231-626(-)
MQMQKLAPVGVASPVEPPIRLARCVRAAVPPHPKRALLSPLPARLTGNRTFTSCADTTAAPIQGACSTRPLSALTPFPIINMKNLYILHADGSTGALPSCSFGSSPCFILSSSCHATTMFFQVACPAACPP